MANSLRPQRRYPLSTIHNLRDLGGFAADEGGMTRWHTFFRSADLSVASPEDINTLLSLGIRTVIDLRMDDEVRKRPDACLHHPGLTHHHISLIGDHLPLSNYTESTLPPMSLLYREMMANGQPLFKRLIELLADGLDAGAVLFHCTAGKDRTGITSMLLLAICGVDRLDTVAEYEVSHTYNLLLMPDDTTGSDPQHMISLLDFLKETYGGPVAYLRNAGVSDQTLQRIRAAFLQPA